MNNKKFFIAIVIAVFGFKLNYGYDPLFDEISKFDFNGIQQVVKKLDEKNIVQIINEKNNTADTPFTFAVREFVDMRKDLESTDSKNKWLYRNRINNLAQIIEFLIQNDIDINARGKGNITALDYSLKNLDEEVARLLIWNGSDIDVLDDNNDSFLMKIVSSVNLQDRDKVLQLILQFKPNLNLQDANGDTALMLAVINNNTETVKILKCAGANLDIVNNNGNTALDIARQNNNQQIIRILMMDQRNCEL